MGKELLMINSPKYFLLIAGDSYYPRSGTRDWIDIFETQEEAESIVERKMLPSYNTRSHHETQFIINGAKYDWYDIVDLREWINK